MRPVILPWLLFLTVLLWVEAGDRHMGQVKLGDNEFYRFRKRYGGRVPHVDQSVRSTIIYLVCHESAQGHRRLGSAETFPKHGPYGDHFLQLAIKYHLGKLIYEFH